MCERYLRHSFFSGLIDALSRASDDLENPDKLRSLLKDLREARQAKSRDGLKTLDHSELSVCVLWLLYECIHSCRHHLPASKSLFHGDQRNSTVLRPLDASIDPTPT